MMMMMTTRWEEDARQWQKSKLPVYLTMNLEGKTSCPLFRDARRAYFGLVCFCVCLLLNVFVYCHFLWIWSCTFVIIKWFEAPWPPVSPVTWQLIDPELDLLLFSTCSSAQVCKKRELWCKFRFVVFLNILCSMVSVLQNERGVSRSAPSAGFISVTKQKRTK